MYNIPVALWILGTHPIHALLCYVRPPAHSEYANQNMLHFQICQSVASISMTCHFNDFF